MLLYNGEQIKCTNVIFAELKKNICFSIRRMVVKKPDGYVAGNVTRNLSGNFETMNNKIIELHNRKRVNDFLSAYHYLGKLPIWKIAFGLLSEENDIELIGVVVIGLPLSRYLMKEKYLEIRRLCLHNAPKNSGSFLIGYALRWCKKNGYNKVVTYADPSVGHEGKIYLAANFKMDGYTSGGSWKGKNRENRQVRYTGKKIRFIWINPRKDAQKTIYTTDEDVVVAEISKLG